MQNYSEAQKIGVFGYGVEGKSLVKYLRQREMGEIVVFDESEQAVKDNIEGVKFVLGPFEKNSYEGLEIAYRSPGIKRNRLEKILKNKVKISTLTNLFFENAKGKIVGVTGTKGKSTTVNLVARILKKNGKKVFIGGNLGISPLDFINELDDDSYSVIELSSFQLDDCRFSPDVAIILPVLLDHLDYHRDEKEYIQSKSSIARYMGEEGLLIVADQKNARKIAEMSKGKKIYFSENVVSQPKSLSKNDTSSRQTFSDVWATADWYTDEKAEGCYLMGDDVFCQWSQKKSEFFNVQKASQEYKVPIVNLLAAVTFAFAFDLKFDPMQDLVGFKKPPFRIEEVADKKGITFYNDSASTNPISAIAAMKTMSKPYALILGGSSKNLRFDELAIALKSSPLLKIVYLTGETASEIEAAIKSAGGSFEIIKKNNLQEIFIDLKTRSKKIKAVLFSPACASFDQFKNYFERGEYFNQLVKEF